MATTGIQRRIKATMHQPRAKPQNGHWTVPMDGAVKVMRDQIRTTWKRRYFRNSRNQNRC